LHTHPGWFPGVALSSVLRTTPRVSDCHPWPATDAPDEGSGPTRLRARRGHGPGGRRRRRLGRGRSAGSCRPSPTPQGGHASAHVPTENKRARREVERVFVRDSTATPIVGVSPAAPTPLPTPLPASLPCAFPNRPGANLTAGTRVHPRSVDRRRGSSAQSRKRSHGLPHVSSDSRTANRTLVGCRSPRSTSPVSGCWQRFGDCQADSGVGRVAARGRVETPVVCSLDPRIVLRRWLVSPGWMVGLPPPATDSGRGQALAGRCRAEARAGWRSHAWGHRRFVYSEITPILRPQPPPMAWEQRVDGSQDGGPR
jgi:hypothetical protein